MTWYMDHGSWQTARTGAPRITAAPNRVGTVDGYEQVGMQSIIASVIVVSF